MTDLIKNFRGPYGENKQSFPDDYIDLEAMNLRSEAYNYEITEHLHSELCQLFFLNKGSGELYSEGREIGLRAPCVVVIPNGVFHGFTFRSDIMGEVMTFSSSFYEKNIQVAPNGFLQFENLLYIPLDNSAAAYADFLDVMNILIKEIRHRSEENTTAVTLLFQLLVIHIQRMSEANPTTIMSSDNSTLVHFNIFQNLIKQHVLSAYSIKKYAQMMGITPVHLNRICRAIAQKTALQILHEFRINEAKRQILTTSHSIAEVAYGMNFKDPSHFNKFFKKQMGLTPALYRKNRLKVVGKS